MMLRMVALALAGAWVLGGQAPAGVRPRPGRPGCRIYPTSVTSTTVGGGVRTVLTYTATFNRSTNQFVTDGTYSDSRGTRNRIKVAAQYDSVADFINEVVRSSGYRGQVTGGSSTVTASAGYFEPTDIGRGVFLSTAFSDNYRTVAGVGAGAASSTVAVSGAPAVASSNAIDWSVNTIPPLRLARAVTTSGDINIRSVNTFDASGRLQRFVATSQPSNVSDTTTYTAWDRFGRPTVGSASRPDSQQTITMVYDDLARTVTTTYASVSKGGGTLTSVSKETFDVNGNSVRTEWTIQGTASSTTTNEFHSMDVACDGPIAPPSVVPQGTGSPDRGYQAKGTMSASIGGASWTAKGMTGSVTQQQIGPKSSDVATILSVGGSDASYTFSFGVSVTDGPGTYTVELQLPDPLKPANPPRMPRGTANALLLDNASKGGWHAATPSIGSGTVTITSLSGTGAAGSFDLVLDAIPGTPASGKRTVSGTFNVRF